jgi:hypothetical protein
VGYRRRQQEIAVLLAWRGDSGAIWTLSPPVQSPLSVAPVHPSSPAPLPAHSPTERHNELPQNPRYKRQFFGQILNLNLMSITSNARPLPHLKISLGILWNEGPDAVRQTWVEIKSLSASTLFVEFVSAFTLFI